MRKDKAITRRELAALEKVFAAEIDGLLPFQAQAKVYSDLCSMGLLQPMLGTFRSVTISGYQLTHAGRYAYCSSPPDGNDAEALQGDTHAE